MRKLDGSTILHTLVCKLPFPIYQESSPDSSINMFMENGLALFKIQTPLSYVYPVLVPKVLVSIRIISTAKIIDSLKSLCY